MKANHIIPAVVRFASVLVVVEGSASYEPIERIRGKERFDSLYIVLIAITIVILDSGTWTRNGTVCLDGVYGH
jgi:hypothetical protein